jgi:iron complex outermembrane recepter protein
MNHILSLPRWRALTPTHLGLRALCLFVTSLALLFHPANAFAQDDGVGATGTITGRVLNMSSGRYVSAARVSVVGTNLEVQTNNFGEYTLRNVPTGEVTLRTTYLGQEPVTHSVTVVAGRTATQNFRLGRASEDGAIVLDEFTVDANRFKTAREIAINEERTSVNIKNVVSADAFGDIPSGNIGEFVKFLPGVQIDYGAFNNNGQGFADDDASGVSIRGFGPEDTAILIDGMPVSSATPGNLSRQVALDQLAVNNASRVELVKVITPDMPMNSIGGQINLITKSAFEYARPIYSGRVFFNVNSNHMTLSKTPGPVDKETYKVTPGLEFTVTQPVTDKFGISFTGFGTREVNQSYKGQPVWNNNHASNYQNGAFVNAAGEPTSTANPVMTRYQITDVGSIVDRVSGNLRFDWKPTPNQLLRANVQYSTYESAEAQRRLDFRPTIATGANWGPDFVIGTTGNSTTAMTVITRDREGDTKSAQMQYNLDVGDWRFYAAGSVSVSESEFKDHENGHFSELALNLNPGRVTLSDISGGIPRHAETFWRTNAGALANTPKDYTVLENWVFDGTTAKSGQAANRSTKGLFRLDVERDLSFLPFLGSNPLKFKFGGRRDQEKEEKWGRGSNYREILRPGASYTVTDVLDDSYLGQTPGFGLPAQQWASTYKLFAIEEANDIFYEPDFDEATNTRVENYNSWVNQQKSITETTDAWYGMLSGSFMKGRLSFVGGARQEHKTRKGRGPFTDGKWDYVKRADGSLWKNTDHPNGVQFSAGSNRPLFAQTPAGEALRNTLRAENVWFPDQPYGSPTSGVRSLASRQLQLIPNREVNRKITGDPSYSLSMLFQLTEKIDLKAGWSRSFGLPKLEDVNRGVLSGNNEFVINEYTSTEQQNQNGALGEIKVANPGLLPETSNNLDFEVSYHTDSGGKLSVSYWYKTVTDQVMNFTTYSGSPIFDAVLPALGLNPEDFQDWRLATSSNSSTKQNTDGWEFEVRQDFGFLGDWGKHFQAFATYSFKSLGQPTAPNPVEITTPTGEVISIVPTVRTITQRANRFGGAGLQFASRRLIAQIRGTYRNDNERGQDRIALINGNFLRRFEPEETRIDLSITYSLNQRFSLFLSGRDIFNGKRKQIVRDDLGLLPEYASTHEIKDFGVDWTFGVNGRF